MTGPAPGATSWATLLASASPLAATTPVPAVQTALLQYTGGTTGVPKGAVLTHRNLRSNAAQGRAWVPGLQDGQEVVYAVLPLFHAYGLTLCLTFAMSIGATLVLFPRFDVDQTLEAVRRRPATFLPGVPPIYQALAEQPGTRGVDLHSIRYAISGAMSLPVATVDLWESVTGGLLVEGYGMTETSPVALGNPVAASRRPGTVGVPFPSTEVRIVDPDDPARRTARSASLASSWCGARRSSPATGAGPTTPTRSCCGRLAPDRRRRGDGRRRLHQGRRPDQGTDHHRWVQRLPLRGGGGAAPVPRRQRRRRRGPAGRLRRRARGRRGRRRTPTPGRSGRSARGDPARISPATRSLARSSSSRSCRAR